MALDAATAKEMIQKLADDRANYLDTLSRAHDVLAKALEASATGKSPPRLTSDAVRRNISPPLASPANTDPFGRRPTLVPSATKDGGSQNELRHTSTTTTVQYEEESETGPKHLIRKLDQGDHRKTNTWSNGNGQGVVAMDRSARHSTSLHGIPEVDNSRRDELSEQDGWVRRVLTWGSGSTKKRRGSEKGEREV